MEEAGKKTGGKKMRRIKIVIKRPIKKEEKGRREEWGKKEKWEIKKQEKNNIIK